MAIVLETEKKHKYGWLFWFAYGAALAASIPNMAYFFSAYTNGAVIEIIISYIISGVIEVTIYATTFAIYTMWKAGLNGKRIFAIIVLVVLNIGCTTISFVTNWVHAVHFQNASMLEGTSSIPFHTVFPIIASVWPFLGIILSLLSKVVTEAHDELKEVDPYKGMSTEEIAQEADRQMAILQLQAQKQQAHAALKGARLGWAARNLGVAVSEAGRGVFGKDTTTPGYGTTVTPQPQLPKDTNRPLLIAKPKAPKVAQQYGVPPTPVDGTYENSEAFVKAVEDATIKEEEEEQQISAAFTHTASPQVVENNPFEIVHQLPDDVKFPIESKTIDQPKQKKAAATPKPSNGLLVQIREIPAKECGYDKSTGRCEVNGVPFANFDVAYQNGGLQHPLITRKALDSIMNQRLLPEKYFRYVLLGGMMKRKVVAEVEQVRDMIVKVISEKDVEGKSIN